MKKYFSQAASILLSPHWARGPVLAFGVLASGQMAHAQTNAPVQTIPTPVESTVTVPIADIPVEELSKKFASMPDTDDTDAAAQVQVIKDILIIDARRNLKDYPVKNEIVAVNDIQAMNPAELMNFLSNPDPHAFPLRQSNGFISSCLALVSSEGGVLWRDIRKDLNAPETFVLPSEMNDASFVQAHENRHCVDRRFASLEDDEKATDDESIILQTEISADMEAARQHKNNLALLNAVAHYRIIEAGMGAVNTLNIDSAIDHMSAFELWRYIGTLDSTAEKHGYLDAAGMKAAYKAFGDICVEIISDDNFHEAAESLHGKSAIMTDHKFSDVYFAARVGLEWDQFKDFQGAMVAREYVSAFESFDALFRTGFKEKVTGKIAEIKATAAQPDTEDTTPPRPQPLIQVASPRP